MTVFNVGDRVRAISGWAEGREGTVVPLGGNAWGDEDTAVRFDDYDYGRNPGNCHYARSEVLELVTAIPETRVGNEVNPNHYKFPGGAEVRDISQWLTANSAQALQYIARSSRIDGQNKGDTVADLKKAIRFLEFEIDRLENL